MANVIVVRYQRRRKIGDNTSPMVYMLKQKAGDSKVYDIKQLATEIEELGSLSAEDVTHVMSSFVRAMRNVLTSGNRVKVDGLGTFYISLSCPGVEKEKDCTVKTISRVNLRFKVDNTLRLVNDSIATTRGGVNNVTFELLSDKPSSGGSGGEGGGGDSGGDLPDPKD